MSLLYPRMTERPPNFRLNPASPLAQGLVFFGGGLVPGGSRMYDGSVYGNHGTLINMDPQTDWVWVPELRRWAMTFEGIDEHVMAPNSTHYNFTSDFTCAAWAHPSSTVANRRLVYRYTNRERGYYLTQNDTDSGQWTFAIFADTIQTIDSDAPPTGDWQHIVGVRHSGQMRIYVDGQQQTDTASCAGSITGTRPLYVGCDYLIKHEFVGDIAEPVLFSRSLTPSEIAALADPGNVDLRVGGVPLILPPRRRIFPDYQRMSSNVA